MDEVKSRVEHVERVESGGLLLTQRHRVVEMKKEEMGSCESVKATKWLKLQTLNFKRALCVSTLNQL